MRSLAFASLFLFLVACGDDDDGGGGGGVDAAVSIDAPTADPDAAVGPDAGGGGTGAVCGGLGNGPCAATHFCDFPDNGCGFDDGTGTCLPRPEVCTDVDQPVCGCDGNVHSNPCDANTAGVDVSQAGGCTVPDNRFVCGELFCADEVQYCQRQVSDIAGVADDFACRSMPLDCTECACVSDEPCGDMCTAGDDGNITLTCPGG